MNKLLKDFPVITEIKVAWGEMDALQHVNNVVYFRYFETARIDYFKHLNIMEQVAKTQIGPVISESHCRYKLPVTFPDTLFVGTRVKDIQADRFTMEYKIVSEKYQKVTTEGFAIVVMFDFANQKKVPISDAFLKAIEEIESKVD